MNPNLSVMGIYQQLRFCADANSLTNVWYVARLCAVLAVSVFSFRNDLRFSRKAFSFEARHQAWLIQNVR